MKKSAKAVAPAALLVSLIASLLVGCTPSSDEGTPSPGAAAQDYKVCMATGGRAEAEWQKAQGEVAAALAKLRGWEFSELSNNNDGPTAAKNIDIFIQQGCDAVMLFNAQTEVNPAMATKLTAANIPTITFDIAQEGWHFVGIDNSEAGKAGGRALGELAKSKWACDVDLVLSGEASYVGIVNEMRVGGMRDGVKEACPNLSEDVFVSFEATGSLSNALPAARDVLAANPQAEKILVVGINDAAVVGTLQAAEQLGRDANIMGWGQDGSLATGPDVNANLKGSVFYFLEGYPVYAFDQILDKLVAGESVAVGDTSENASAQVEVCAASAGQAQKIPSLDERVQQLLSAPAGSTATSLFCS